MMERRDIMLWPDGFWCFHDEYQEHWLRDKNFRVLLVDSPEWLATKVKPAIPPS